LPKGGFELANGEYAVTIYPIHWEAEAGSMTSDRKRTADALPEFVILFKHLDDAHGVEAALTPVYFPPFVAGGPSPAAGPMASAWSQGQYEQSAEEVRSQPHILVTIPTTSLIVTGFTQTVVDVDNVREEMKNVSIRGAPLVLTPNAREGALAIVDGGLVSGYVSPSPVGPGGQLTLTCGRLVRIRALRRDQGLTWAQLEAVDRKSSIVSASEISALKREIEETA
jgi:hypothetical protein